MSALVKKSEIKADIRKSVDSGALSGKPSLIQIFISFFFLGCRSFGGPAMVNNIRHLAVDKKRWIPEESFHRAVAFCQSIPGAIAMQVAAHAGQYVRGIPGAAAAFVGFGTPAFIIMLLFSFLFGRAGFSVFLFNGMRMTVVAIIFHSAIDMGKNRLKDWRNYPFIIMGIITFLVHVHILIILAVSILASLFFPKEKAGKGSVAVDIPSFSKRSDQIILCVIFLAGIGTLISLYFINQKLFTLCATMSKVDLLAFGGGFASVPVMYQEVVERLGIISPIDFLGGMILGQATPGPIVITATFVGYISQKLPGAILATIFVFLPSFLLVTSLSKWYYKIIAYAKVRIALDNIFASFLGFIIGTGITLALGGPMCVTYWAIIIMLFTFLIFRVPTLLIVGIGILAAFLGGLNTFH